MYAIRSYYENNLDKKDGWKTRIIYYMLKIKKLGFEIPYKIVNGKIICDLKDTSRFFSASEEIRNEAVELKEKLNACFMKLNVITSYSIHYTKLYEAFTTDNTPILMPPGSEQLSEASPPLVACDNPRYLPMVAPVPAPMLPSSKFLEALRQALYPESAFGLTDPLPIPRS